MQKEFSLAPAFDNVYNLIQAQEPATDSYGNNSSGLCKSERLTTGFLHGHP